MIRVSFWTCVFLIVLRIAIGWHFCYEGIGKVKSAYQGKASTDKVFSSETYFRESEGPFGKLVKSRMADPDRVVIEQLTLKPVDGDSSKVSSASRFPDALAVEWDDYFNRFVDQYKLDETQKSSAQTAFDQSKAKYVAWVQGNSDEMDPKTKKPKRILLSVKRKAPGINNESSDFEQEMTVAERAAEFQKKSAEVRTAYEKMAKLGKAVDATELRTLKSEAAAIRKELRGEIDDQTKAMKDRLAKQLDVRVTAFSEKSGNQDEVATLEAMLTPMEAGNNPLGKMWDEYAAYVKEFSPELSDEQKAAVDEEMRMSKLRFDRWLDDKDMYSGKESPTKEVAEWRSLYATAKAKAASAGKEEKQAAEKDRDLLIDRMQADLKSQSDSMRKQVGTPLLGTERAKGYAEPSKDRYLWLFPKYWTLIDYIDWSTRWFLLVVGAMLMIGLFTRLSCFSAAIFLALTILTQPNVPWLPAAPNNEGSYLFVNKNVIEMVALLALMTTRTGLWFGVDAMVSWMFGRRRKANG